MAPEGRLPTQSALPDCLGFRGGPRGDDGIAAVLDPELPRLAAVKGSKVSQFSFFKVL